MINSRTWLNIALLILVAAAALVMVYLPGLQKPAPPVTLSTLQPEQITRIHIQRDGQQDITLVKTQQGWRMTAPYTLPASEFHVQALLHFPQAASHTRIAAQGQDLSKFNLATPRVRLRLNDTDFTFGDNEPLSQRRYVLLGQTIHLIDDNDYYRLIAEPASWVSAAPLPDDAQIEELSLPAIRLTRRSDGRWSLTPSSDVSADAINTLLDEWRNAQALQVRAYTKDAAQGAHETVQVRLQNETLQFAITARTPELILARPDAGVQYHFPEELAGRLLEVQRKEAREKSK